MLNELQGNIPGVQALQLDIATDRLTIGYDCAKITFSNIAEKLQQVGIKPIESRWFRLKAAWYDYTDRNAAQLAHERPKACCNKIPKA